MKIEAEFFFCTWRTVHRHKETFIAKIQKLMNANKSIRNDGKRVDSPRIFGLVLQKKSDLEEIAELKNNFREKENKNKQMQIHNKKAVNQKQKIIVDPKSKKKHSQLIECLWGEAKSTILKRSRGSFKNN